MVIIRMVADTQIVPVILCGGEGKRLYPLSTPESPKPFLRLFGQESLLQQTWLRIKDMPAITAPMLVGAQNLEPLMRQHMAELGLQKDVAYILEPMQQGTAAAILLAAYVLLGSCDASNEPVMLVCPSDHWLRDEERYREVLMKAAEKASHGEIVLLGVEPLQADTGYGYVCVAGEGNGSSFQLASFEEKPSVERAEELIESGESYWNSGVFLFKPSAIIAAAERYIPSFNLSMYDAFKEGHSDGNSFYPERIAYTLFPAISIDCAIMEKLSKALLFPLKVEWSDVGTLERLESVRKMAEHEEQTV